MQAVLSGRNIHFSFLAHLQHPPLILYNGNARFDFFASQMEKNFFIKEISAEDFDLSGKIIEIDKTLLANLEDAEVTP